MPHDVVDAQQTLEEAGERWLELHAAGKDTSGVERRISAATQRLTELETEDQYEHSN